VGETPHLFPVLWGLRLFYVARAELDTAYELGQQLLRLAQRTHDATFLLEAHRALGDTLFYLGELDRAQAHLDQGTTLYNLREHRAHTFLYGQDPGVACLSYGALALWLRGFPDQAHERSEAALTLTHELSHPFSQVLALNLTALLDVYRQEGQAAQERAEAVIALSSELGFLFRVAWGTILRGWALAVQGHEEEGIAQMGQGLAAWQATGTELAQPQCLALLAAVHGKAGQPQRGLTLVAEALARVQRTREQVAEAELYRLQGELLLQHVKFKVEERLASRVQKEAEGWFQKAVEVARQQQAKSLELRATMSLARLWQQQGKKAEARQMLAEIYGWFTEGFDTKDLQEAKALLEELT
jgi:predicted ATPase